MMSVENMSAAYQISLARVVFEKLIEDTKSDAKIPDCLNLFGVEWIKPIQKAVSESENIAISLSVDRSRLYPKPKKANTSYLTVHAQCSYCRTSGKNAYKMVVQTKPSGDLVIFNVFRRHEHNHKEKHQIRGDERKVCVSQVKQTANGSAVNFINKCEGAGMEIVPNAVTLRKMISEEMNNSMVSTNWMVNMQYVRDTCKELIKGRVFDGYVQSTELCKYLICLICLTILIIFFKLS